MSMASTVQRYLEAQHVPYELVNHPPTDSSLRTASKAGIPAHRLAKAVMLEDEDGMLMAVLPADRRVQLGELRRHLGHPVGLATEYAMAKRFPDCKLGAVPPVGPAYGLRTIVEDELDAEPEVYLEAGDHEALMRLQHDDFARLMRDADHGHFVR